MGCLRMTMSFSRVFMSGRVVALCVMFSCSTMRLCSGFVRLCRFGMAGAQRSSHFISTQETPGELTGTGGLNLR